MAVMTGSEKVLTGIGCCIGSEKCDDCPFHEEKDCLRSLLTSAMAEIVLKEIFLDACRDTMVNNILKE